MGKREHRRAGRKGDPNAARLIEHLHALRLRCDDYQKAWQQ